MKTVQIMEHGRIKEIDALDDETFADTFARYKQNTKLNRIFDLAEFRRDPEVFTSPRLQVMDDYYYSIEKEVRREKLDKVRQVRLEKEAEIRERNLGIRSRRKFFLVVFVVSLSWKMFNYFYPEPVIYNWWLWLAAEHVWIPMFFLLFLVMSWFSLFSSSQQNGIMGIGFIWNLFK